MSNLDLAFIGIAAVLLVIAVVVPVHRAPRRFDDADPLGEFLNDCVSTAPGESVTARGMYQAYQAYCAANGDRPIFETQFARRISAMLKRVQGLDTRFYLDVALHDVPQIIHSTKASPLPEVERVRQKRRPF